MWLVFEEKHLNIRTNTGKHTCEKSSVCVKGTVALYVLDCFDEHLNMSKELF
jgi:hypothetical protein